MKIDIDGEVVDNIVIQALTEDRRILTNILTREDDEYTKAVAEAIDVVLGYYSNLPLKDIIHE